MPQFRLPDLGEGLEEAQLVQWLVQVGEQVRLNQPLCQVETAKALADIPSPFAGTVQALYAAVGDAVPVGAPLLHILTAEEANAPEAQPSEQGGGPMLVGYGTAGPAQPFARRRRGAALSAPAAEVAPSPSAAPAATGERASPLVRKIAAERGIDLRALVGTGPGGRIRVEDLERLPTPGESAEDEERISTVGLRKAIAAKMVRAATTIPHFTEYGLFDATALLALRDRVRAEPRYAGAPLTLLPFLAAAVLTAMRGYPILNARWDEEGNAIVIKKRINLGLATDTPRGLLVPVVRDAQRLAFADLAREIGDLVRGAREGSLAPHALTGGTLTITNVGASGPVETGTPLINAPEVCIIGFGAIRPRPTVVGDRVEVRPGAWISIACDHRVVDGAEAARFLGALVAALEAPARLVE